MSGVIGKSWRLYYNTLDLTVEANYDTPTWGEIEDAQDIDLNLEKELIEVLRRAANFKEYVVSFADFLVDFAMNYRRGVTAFDAINTHYFAFDNTFMHFLILDGPVGTSGSVGFQFPGVVSNFGRTVPIAGKTEVPTQIAPTLALYGSTVKEIAAITIP